MALSRTCLVCCKNFLTKKCFVDRGQEKSCSRSCHYASMRSGQLVQCGTCGKEIYRKPRLLRLAKNKKYFCNKSCQTLWRNQIYIGPKHANWKDGHAAYGSSLKRSGRVKMCEVCKTTDERVLDVHHIDRIKTNIDPANLAWLCRDCHFLVHHYDVGHDRELLKARS